MGLGWVRKAGPLFFLLSLFTVSFLASFSQPLLYPSLRPTICFAFSQSKSEALKDLKDLKDLKHCSTQGSLTLTLDDCT